MPSDFFTNSFFLQDIIYRFTKTLGVPCAEIYPLNLMQLVLPKGKVRQYPIVFFLSCYRSFLSFKKK